MKTASTTNKSLQNQSTRQQLKKQSMQASSKQLELQQQENQINVEGSGQKHFSQVNGNSGEASLTPFQDSSNIQTSVSQREIGLQGSGHKLPFATTEQKMLSAMQNSSGSQGHFLNSQSTPQLAKFAFTQSQSSQKSNNMNVASPNQNRHASQHQLANVSSQNILPAGLNLDENQLRQALLANLMEKQQSIDRLQSYIQRVNFEMAQKVERCEYLRGLQEVKSKETADTELSLKREILEVSERLEILALFTKREQFSSKQLKDKNTFKLEVQEQKLEKLEQEKAQLVEQTQATELEVRCMEEERELKLRAALRPLEDARREVEQQMQIFEARSRVQAQHKERIHKVLLGLLNDQSKITQAIQHINDENCKLENEMNQMRSAHPDEWEIFLREFAEEQQLKSLLQEKLKLTHKITRQDKYCAKLAKQIAKTEDERNTTLTAKSEKLQKQIREINNFKQQTEKVQAANPNLKRNAEISKVESFLRDREEEFKTPSGLFEVVAEDTQLNNILLKYQVPHLERALEQLKTQFTAEDQKRDEELHELKLEILNHNPAPSNPGESTATLQSELTQAKAAQKWATERYNSALENQKEQRFLFKRKAQALQHKIQEIKGIVINEAGFDLESVKVEYLKKMWARMSCDQDEKNNFHNILSLYIQRLQDREALLSPAILELQQVEEEQKSKSEVLEKRRLELVNEQDSLEQSHQQIKELTKKEKAISHSLEERQTQIEFQLFKFGERSFEEYYQRHEVLFEGVKKTYGKKVCDKMKTQQKKEFIEITVQQYKRRIQELKDRQIRIDENCKVLRVKEMRLEEQVSRDIRKTQHELALQETELAVIQMQFQATIEALVELDREIEVLKGQKLMEIKKTVQKMFKAKNYDSQKVRIQSLEDEISKKQKFVHRLRLEVEDKETTVFEKTTNYKAEEQGLKMRLETFKRAQVDLQKTIKPQLSQMEREIQELSYQVNSGRRKLEGFFQKYTILLQQQSQLKRTILEHFPSIDLQHLFPGVEAQQNNVNQEESHEKEGLEGQELHNQIKQFSIHDVYEEEADQQFHSQNREEQNHRTPLNVDISQDDERPVGESFETPNVPRISEFQFEEEYKKLQLIIDADERMKNQPLVSQVIQEISEEYEDEKSTQKPQTRSVRTIQSQISAKRYSEHSQLQTENDIKPNLQARAKNQSQNSQKNELRAQHGECNKQSTKQQEKLENMARLEQNMLDLLSSNSSSSCMDISRGSHHSITPGPRLPNGDLLIELNCVTGEKLSIELIDCLPNEFEYLNKIKVLLQGEEIFKKFGTSSSMNLKPFDPLELSTSPEQRQFGRRYLRLTPCLTKLEIYKLPAAGGRDIQSVGGFHQPQSASSLNGTQTNNQNQKNISLSNQSASIHARSLGIDNAIHGKLQLESTIELERVIKLLIPTVTQDIVKHQKQGGLLLRSTNHSQSYSQHSQSEQATALSGNAFAKQLTSNKQQLMGARRDQEEYKEKCFQARYYPFSLILEDKTLECVCSDIVAFKILTDALEELLKRKLLSSKLSRRVQVVNGN